jgi:hypothetical protein
VIVDRVIAYKALGSMDGEEAVSQARHVGVRLYMGLDCRSLRWYTDDGKEVKCAWDEMAGLRNTERAVRYTADVRM